MNYKNIYKPKDVKALSELLHNSTEKKSHSQNLIIFIMKKVKKIKF